MADGGQYFGIGGENAPSALPIRNPAIRLQNTEQLRRDAETELFRIRPEASCTLGLTPAQMRLARQLGCVVSLGLIALPTLTLIGLTLLVWAFFACLVAQRAILIGAGWFSRREDPASQESPPKKGRKQIWPVYTILVPVYREPAAVHDLIAALKGLDYPKRQLDILILLEESDDLTFAALQEIQLRPCFRIVRIPEGEVQTKPRALNFGLKLARGQFVAIYDAEDQMHAGQIKAAVRAFQNDRIERGVPPLACVQAPLVPHNGGEGWIASQFTQEYGVHFGLIVPGLTKLRCPVPLGGTSNHFDKRILQEIGGWDPFNVTEDADLGLRIAQAGYRVGSITPPTYEEAPVKWWPWVKQRSRWIKGFMQTLGVFLRHPARSMNEMGRSNFVWAVLYLGGSVVSSLLHGPGLIVLLLTALIPGLAVPALALGLCGAGLSVHILSCVLTGRVRSFSSALAMISAPLYWPLQSFAAAKAIFELFRDPYYWDKTEHGVSAETLSRKKIRH
ncbi:MAG: glycosyl transferase [Ponticaulis sp.]|nr:glycosyl transferase [Ponticaulis sp.]